MLITATSSRPMTGMLLVISDISVTVWGISQMEEEEEEKEESPTNVKVQISQISHYSEICNNCYFYGRSSKWGNGLISGPILSRFPAWQIKSHFNSLADSGWKKWLSATFKPLEWNYRMCILSVWSHSQLVNECSFMRAEVSDSVIQRCNSPCSITHQWESSSGWLCFTVLIPAHWIIGCLNPDYYTTLIITQTPTIILNFRFFKFIITNLECHISIYFIYAHIKDFNFLTFCCSHLVNYNEAGMSSDHH